MRIRPDLRLERALWDAGVDAVAGVDEVGVGAWAGPVMAAAVIFTPGTVIEGLADSKLLTARRREALFAVIAARALGIGIGRAEAAEVDRLNVYWAAMLARQRAVEALRTPAAYILVDGKRRIEGCGLRQTPVVDGDARSATVAAASIVAKVTRDAFMQEYGESYPLYGFARHKGYGTAEHLAALAQFGPTPLHRRTFAPVMLLERRQLMLGFGTNGDGKMSSEGSVHVE